MINFPTETAPTGGYLALPEGGQGPGVLVLHAWWGLTGFFKEFCDRLAGEGFVVLAPDLYGNGATAETIAEAEELIGRQEFEATQAVALGAVDYLRNHPAVQGDKIGVVGFSMGAAWAMLLAAVFKPADVGAVAIFYGIESSIEWDDFARTKAAFLGHFAENDPYESLETIRQTEAEIKKAGRPVTFHVYPGTGHWFFESNRPDAYNAAAAQLAWERTLAFLHHSLHA
ncbi:MAG: dienelactone hydrolase family protein [Chloroflexi bacterium]|nr:dienelactone hydrolase family protein [Chloroflexota bacterium]MCI0577311.1 dienelactone hydrolase family protein [Chloroflexota bacterium]MCI0644726.1 dienelactone hydrolase family protein [Chloroflexota bacterium]MCI0726699.1 dienelactone hydrolase family protein [Chloroflexota bacterium]